MKSVVYHADPAARAGRSLLDKLSELFDESGGPDIFLPEERVAVKVHFGEEGNTSYLNPSFARLLVGKLKELGARPFLTDTNTLYRGQRHRTEDHLKTARRHGFSEEAMGCPLIIGDEFVEVGEEGQQSSKAMVARAVGEADSLLVITHVTGHVIFGYGGALKNVSMGFASPVGKQNIHSDLKPKVNQKKCVGCGTCVEYCPVDAITLIPSDSSGRACSASRSSKLDHYNGKGKDNAARFVKARIDKRKCIGCAECITACPVGAIPPIWKGDPSRLAVKSAAYARAALSNKEGKLLCFNFLLNVTPDCDCCDWSEPPFVPDQGILASRDIVAIDQASVDLVRKAPLLPGCTAVKKGINLSRKKISSSVSSQYSCLPRLPDKFRSLFGVEVEPFLAEAERCGLGSRSYRLIKIP